MNKPSISSFKYDPLGNCPWSKIIQVISQVLEIMLSNPSKIEKNLQISPWTSVKYIKLGTKLTDIQYLKDNLYSFITLGLLKREGNI